MPNHLTERATAYLGYLCRDISNRRVGSAGNRAATDFFARTMRGFGFAVEGTPFDCIDWHEDGADLTVGGLAFDAQPSPYSLGCDVSAPLVAAASIAELEATDAAGKILLLHGEIAKEQVMPKNFPFYNPDEHRQIVALVEAKAPAALVCATGRNTQTAGGVYPFPMFEDGDFDIPSVYMTEEEGQRLAAHVGATAALTSRATRIPSSGEQIVARKAGRSERRIVVFAHIDAKIGTPGAIDNGTGVITLLLLGELLREYDGDLGLEIVAINGEDYYLAPGEKIWIAQNDGCFDEIAVGINVDGAGYKDSDSAFSLYGCPPEIETPIRKAFAAYPALTEGEPWYQSDHSLFVFNGRPALALTSADYWTLSAQLTHTPEDKPEIVAIERLVEIANGLRDVIVKLNDGLMG
ncbi:MAG: M28 family peptidase [Anaerolineae bacterium]|nr:M28 family peptidase [Anaerolineae bacterium]